MHDLYDVYDMRHEIIWHILSLLVLLSYRIQWVLRFHRTRCICEHVRLEQEREEHSLLGLVLVAKLLAVGSLLALGPDVHLGGTNRDEEGNGPVAGDNDDTDPGEDLVHVVGARHQTEAVALGNLALSATRGTQRRQVHVDGGVGKLADSEQTGSNRLRQLVVGRGQRGGRSGAVDGHGAKQTRHQPVEGAVLEEVAGGHRVGRELVHEERLKLALEEVDHEQSKRQVLRLGKRLVTTGEDKGSGGDNGEVDKDRAEVFDYEDASPGDLGTCASKAVSIMYLHPLRGIIAYRGP